MKYIKMMYIALLMLLQNFLVYASPSSNTIQVVYDFMSEKNKSTMENVLICKTGEHSSNLIFSKVLFFSQADMKTDARIKYNLSLPQVSSRENLALVFHYSIQDLPDNAPLARGDAFTMGVKLNNASIFTKIVNTKGWRYQYIDLTKYSGQNCELTFISRASNTKTNAVAQWGEPQVIKTSPSQLFYSFKNQLLLPVESVEFLIEDQIKDKGLSLINQSNEGPYQKKNMDQELYVAPGLNPTDKSGRSNYLYFAVDDKFIFDGNWANAAVTLEYLDRGKLPFNMEYDSLDMTIEKDPKNPGAFKEIRSELGFGNTYKKKIFTYHLLDARFANKTNACDFRLIGSEYYIQKVTVSKLYPRLYGPPAKGK